MTPAHLFRLVVSRVSLYTHTTVTTQEQQVSGRQFIWNSAPKTILNQLNIIPTLQTELSQSTQSLLATAHSKHVHSGTAKRLALLQLILSVRLQLLLLTFPKSTFGRLVKVVFMPLTFPLVATRFQATSVFARLSLQITLSISTANPFSRDLFLTRASTLTEFILHPLQKLLKMIFFFLWRLALMVQDFIRRFSSLSSSTTAMN